MAGDKDYNYDQSKLIPISYSRQILPGSFEYTLSHPFDFSMSFRPEGEIHLQALA
ncbi:MAG: hypothetical protein K2P57_07165 [Burkholderiales bacterium]|nr:hypothetical protein [Burkholderiales bacterium]